MLDAAKAGTFRMDPATGELRWSASLAVLRGLDPGEAPATFDEFLERVHPEDRDGLRAAVEATPHDGTTCRYELRMRSPDGVVHWYDSRWRLADEDGGAKIVGLARLVDAEHVAMERMRFLADVSAALDASLDMERTLSAVADRCVRDLADWCIIDMADADGQLRSVAVAHADPVLVDVARTMRHRYPPAVDRPRGVPSVVRSGRPELYAQVDEAALERWAHDAEHLEFIRTLDTRSVVIAPLRARGQVLGAITLVRTRKRRPYTEDDLAFVSEVAARAGLAVDNARLYGEARAQERVSAEAAETLRVQRDLYEALMRAQSELGQAFVLLEGDRMVYVNAATEALTARSADELLAMPSLLGVLPEDVHRTVMARLIGARAGREPAEPFRTEILRPDGTRVPIEAAGRRLGGDLADQMVIIARDISERVAQERELQRVLEVEQAARRASEAAHARVRLLSDVSALLERSLSSDDALQEVAELLVARLADTCTLDIADFAGGLRRAAADARAPERRDRLLAKAGDPRVERAMGYEQATFVDEVGSPDDAVLGQSAAFVPLVARGRPVGVLSLGWRQAGHRSARDEWSLIVALAQRVALAVDGALQYRERAHVAQTLQASLLPAALPRIPGISIAAEYLAAGEGMEVGGDFYDAFELDDGTWALVIGDVLGKGAEAAAVTALARYTLRAVAGGSPSPAAALATLNAEMLRQKADRRFVTAVLARLEPGPDGARLIVASGGHPPPVVLRADGATEVVRSSGMLLGVDPGAASHDVEVSLVPGDSLVLYTDGVTEARRDRPLTAEALAAELAGTAADGAAALAREIVRLAEHAANGPLRDDLAALVVAVTGSG